MSKGERERESESEWRRRERQSRSRLDERDRERELPQSEREKERQENEIYGEIKLHAKFKRELVPNFQTFGGDFHGKVWSLNVLARNF